MSIPMSSMVARNGKHCRKPPEDHKHLTLKSIISPCHPMFIATTLYHVQMKEVLEAITMGMSWQFLFSSLRDKALMKLELCLFWKCPHFCINNFSIHLYHYIMQTQGCRPGIQFHPFFLSSCATKMVKHYGRPRRDEP